MCVVGVLFLFFFVMCMCGECFVFFQLCKRAFFDGYGVLLFWLFVW